MLIKHRKKYIIGSSLLIGLILIMSIMLIQGNASQESREIPKMLLPESPGIIEVGNEMVSFDVSNANHGYFTAKYKGNNPKVKIKVTKNNKEIIYDLNKSKYGEYESIPFTHGNGTYVIKAYQNLFNTKYATVFEHSIDVDLHDPNLPFLYPSNMIDYDEKSYIVKAAYKATQDSKTELEAAMNICHYLSDQIIYDEQLTSTKLISYIPDVDEVLKSRSGICIDYATVMTAMMRSQGIPTKLVVGRAVVHRNIGPEEDSHAWVLAYISDATLPEKVKNLDKSFPGWVLLDPTYGKSKMKIEYMPERYY